MPDINERRLLQRTNLALYLKVLDSSNNTSLGNIIDINVCGFLLLTKLTMQEEAQYSVKIELPENFGSGNFIECSAVVRRAAKSVNPSFNEVGLEINTITPEARELVEQLEQQLLLKFSPN